MRLRCQIPLAPFELDIDASFDARVTAMFGPSGSGKTTLLDAIAGLKEIAAGEIEIGGRVLYSSSQKINLSPQQRAIGYVPQETALFPNLSVRKNILFGASRKTNINSKAAITLEHVAELLEINHLLNRWTQTLSGGESQRVALARALLSRPELLLLDEPLASLDVALKEKIIPYLRRVRDEFAVPIIYVTHDPVEVLSLADWVIVIHRGRLVSQGIAREVLMSRPVFADLEEDQVENVFRVRFVDSEPQAGRSRTLLDSGQELFIPYMTEPKHRSLQIRIRGDEILIATKRPEAISAGNILRGIVAGLEVVGGEAVLKIDAGDIFYARLTSSAVQRLGLAPGREVFMIIKTRSCIPL